MSEPGYPPAEQSARSSEIPLWVILGGLLLVVIGAGVAAVSVMSNHRPAAHEVVYPRQWDPRIAPYVRIAARERGLTFLHPVAVRFVADKEFEKGIRTDEKDLGKSGRKELDQATGMMRALGLLSGNVDLFQAFNDAHGAGTLAYYSFEDKRITVRGTTITPAMRPTLVHELTHVLQDQNFDIGARLLKLGKQNAKKTTTEYDVLDAIVEGDAERTATLYRESLSAKERRALARSSRAQDQRATQGYSKLPQVVVTLMTAPYTLGQQLVQTAATGGGNRAIDELLRDAPAHDIALLDPLRALAGKTDAAKVPAPALASGEKEFDSGEFGAVSWYLMLAQRMPIADALEAAEGWNGDAYVAFERSGVSCARLALEVGTGATRVRLTAALHRWAAGSPGSPARITGAGDVLTLESCDPGTKAKAGKESSIDALDLVSLRGQLGAEFLKQGAPLGAARCLADKVVQAFPISTLTASKVSPADTARIRQLALSCRGAR
jgi:hypothetical protein